MPRTGATLSKPTSPQDHQHAKHKRSARLDKNNSPTCTVCFVAKHVTLSLPKSDQFQISPAASPEIFFTQSFQQSPRSRFSGRKAQGVATTETAARRLPFRALVPNAVFMLFIGFVTARRETAVSAGYTTVRVSTFHVWQVSCVVYESRSSESGLFPSKPRLRRQSIQNRDGRKLGILFGILYHAVLKRFRAPWKSICLRPVKGKSLRGNTKCLFVFTYLGPGRSHATSRSHGPTTALTEKTGYNRKKMARSYFELLTS